MESRVRCELLSVPINLTGGTETPEDAHGQVRRKRCSFPWCCNSYNVVFQLTFFLGSRLLNTSRAHLFAPPRAQRRNLHTILEAPSPKGNSQNQAGHGQLGNASSL